MPRALKRLVLPFDADLCAAYGLASAVRYYGDRVQWRRMPSQRVRGSRPGPGKWRCLRLRACYCELIVNSEQAAG